MPCPPASKPVLLLNGDALGEHADLAATLFEAGLKAVFRNIEEIAVELGPHGPRIRETVTGRDLADFGLVQVLALPRPTATLLNSVADYLAVKGVHGINVTGVSAPTRLFTYVRLANRGLSVPATSYLPSVLFADAFGELSERLDLPFVVKTVTGGRASRSSLVSDEVTFARGLGDGRQRYLAQELVPPGGSCLLLVLGGRVVLAQRHHGLAGEDLLARPKWREAPLVEPRTLDSAALQAAEDAAAALDFDVAAVHVVRHWTTGRWCVLDVSSNLPISAGHPAEKYRAYTAHLGQRLAGPAPLLASGGPV